MDPDSTERGAEDLWDLTIDDLFSTSDAAASDLGSAIPGQYTIDLCTSVEPASELAPSLRDFEQLHAYQVTDWKDDRLVFRLRLGPIDSELEADAILSIVRRDYPQATALPVGDDDLRMIAIVAASAPARGEPPMAPAATAARTAAPPAPLSVPAPTIAAPAVRAAAAGASSAHPARVAASRVEPAISPPKAVTPTVTPAASPPPPVAEPMDFGATFRDLATELLAPIQKAPRPRPRPPEAPAVPPPPVLTAAVAGKGAPPATAPRAAAQPPAAAPPVLKLEEVARPPRERTGPRDAARVVGAEPPRTAARADSPANASPRAPATDVAPVQPDTPSAHAAPIVAPRPTATAPVRGPEPPSPPRSPDPPAVTAPAAAPVRPLAFAPAERAPTPAAAPPANPRPQETAAANPVSPSAAPAPSREPRSNAGAPHPATPIAAAERASTPRADAPASRPAESPRVSLRARPQTTESTSSQANAAISPAALIVEPGLTAARAGAPPLAATPAAAAAPSPRPASPDVEFELELLPDDSAGPGSAVVVAATRPSSAIPAALLTTLELVPDELPRPAVERAGAAAIDVAAQAPPAVRAVPVEPPRAAPTPRPPNPATLAKPSAAPKQSARPDPAHGTAPTRAAAVGGRTAPGPAPSTSVATKPAAPHPAAPKPATAAPAVTAPSAGRPVTARPGAAGPVRPPPPPPVAAQKPAAPAPKAAHADTGPAIDSTQTVRALVVPDKGSQSDKLLVIQLMLSEREIAPENVPNLAIFNEYRLYSAVGYEQGKVMHALRLGFFTDEGPAEAVAGYLRAYFDAPVVTRVSFEERDRFAKRRVDARMNSSDTGIHTAIELSSAPTAPATSLADLSARARSAEPGKVKRGRS